MSHIEPLHTVIASKWASASVTVSHYVFLDSDEFGIDGVEVSASFTHPFISGTLDVTVRSCEDDISSWVAGLLSVLDRTVKTAVAGNFGAALWCVFHDFAEGFKYGEQAFGSSYFLTYTPDNGKWAIHLSHLTITKKTALWSTEFDNYANTHADDIYCMAQIENVLRTQHKSSKAQTIMAHCGDSVNFYNK